MSEGIDFLVIQKLARANKLYYHASNNIDLILAGDGATLEIGSKPGVEISDETVKAAMEEFLNS